MSFFRLVALFLSLAALGACAATDTQIPPLRDLRAEATTSRQHGQPIVLFFHSRTCRYCRQVEEDYLRGVMAENARAPRILLRAVDIDSDAQLVDFNGATTTARAYARAQGVRLVPHLKFIGPRGEALAADMVGLTTPDFYAGYLEAAISESVAKLKADRK